MEDRSSEIPEAPLPGLVTGALAALLVAGSVTASVLGTRDVAGRLAVQAALEEQASRLRQVRRRLDNCARRVESLRRTRGELPEEHEWPECLRNRSRSRIRIPSAVDPWGHLIEYVRTGPETYALISRGADGLPGGEGLDADHRIDR